MELKDKYNVVRCKECNSSPSLSSSWGGTLLGYQYYVFCPDCNSMTEIYCDKKHHRAEEMAVDEWNHTNAKSKHQKAFRMNSQASLTDQLAELYLLANRARLYDAADYVQQIAEERRGRINEG